jgi:hypothetical protein
MAGSCPVIDEFAKEYLHDELRWIRAAMPWKLDGLSEYDIRRPLTPTGTNLLGMIKHLATWEARYFGDVFDRPFPEPLPRWDDEDWVVRTTQKLLRPGGRERFIWLVNLLLLLCMTLCIASGILISEVALPELGITLHSSSFWRQMHDTTATLTLILVPIHAALRWRWIVGVARRFAAWRPGRSR